MGRPRLNPTGASPAPVGDANPGDPKNVATIAGDTGVPVSDTATPRESKANDPVREYVVAPGHTLTTNGRKILRPGDPVLLDDGEMHRLLELGFIVPSTDDSESGGGVSVGGLKVIGGHRPGGVVI